MSRAVKSKSTRTTEAARVAVPEILRAANLEALPWLVHGFSTRRGGISQAYGGAALNLGLGAEDSRENVLKNREIFLCAAGACSQDRKRAPWPLVALRQVHSDRIHFADVDWKAGAVGDGLVSGRPGLALAITTADCLPVLLADPEKRAVGIFHAGWRGTVARIAEKGVGEMARRFGSNSQDLVAAIGPGIHVCCYAVGEEVRGKFQSQFEYTEELFQEVFSSDAVRQKYPLLFMTARAPGHGETGPALHLDLVKANRMQLLHAGLRAGNITASDLCTACRVDLLFSHRAERGRTGRMMAIIGISKELRR
jgi:polyphenol oxidase